MLCWIKYKPNSINDGTTIPSLFHRGRVWVWLHAMDGRVEWESCPSIVNLWSGNNNGLFGWSGGCQKTKKLIPRYFFCYGQIFSENFFFFFFNFLSPITYGFCEALNICSIIDKGTTESARTKLFSHERPKLGNHPVRVLMEMDSALGFRNKSLH